MAYELIKEFNLLADRKRIIWLNVWSIIVFLSLLFIGAMYFAIIHISVDFLTILLFFVTFFVILIIHESIHGLFFKLFKPDVKVKFGFKNGVAYATSPGAIYSKDKFIVICLMPFILITLLLYSFYLSGVNGIFLYFLFAMHTGGCVGDFYFFYLLLKQKNSTHVEDTEQGFKLYKQ
ncbi:hypothetical protein BN1058_01437 [Paraliobacillus sp. PM-2]|uniref:DUF3267 domain-containing protein n=1 Tax=Paraliobacillus sp. PM-2 TaxID=1462524 RepID=UPI00061C4F8E|nr:DUF3267 domain-containing protein [Paraliobacillus sp. PM-2]CQR47146.1 hypothetical protein BN1058_01437 [Paraliobacillus sp. PM-2]